MISGFGGVAIYDPLATGKDNSGLVIDRSTTEFVAKWIQEADEATGGGVSVAVVFDGEGKEIWKREFDGKG